MDRYDMIYPPPHTHIHTHPCVQKTPSSRGLKKSVIDVLFVRQSVKNGKCISSVQVRWQDARMAVGQILYPTDWNHHRARIM